MKKVLIVDDSNLSRQKLRGMITELGYEVVGEACDGLEAIDLIDKEKKLAYQITTTRTKEKVRFFTSLTIE